MTTKIKIIISLLALMTGMIWIGGCKKSGPSIVGTWTRTSYKILMDSDNVVIVDTTYMNKISSDTFAFYADGQCVFGTYTNPVHRTYKLVGNTIVMHGTIGNTPFDFTDTIVSLTDHSLMLSQRVYPNYNTSNSDTIIYVSHITLGYSR
jgi:hypothetical protein